MRYEVRSLSPEYIFLEPGAGRNLEGSRGVALQHRAGLPRLMRCFSPDRIPGVSMILMLSRTGLGSCAHMNLQGSKARESQSGADTD